MFGDSQAVWRRNSEKSPETAILTGKETTGRKFCLFEGEDLREGNEEGISTLVLLLHAGR